MKHPTWTHGQYVQRVLSGVNRAELMRHGMRYSVVRRWRCCRRRGEDVVSPRLRTAMIAWHAWRTVGSG